MAFRRPRWHALSIPAEVFGAVVFTALMLFWGRDAMSLTVRRLIAVTGTTLVTLASVGATTVATSGTAWTAGPRHASLVMARPGQVAAAAAAVTAAGGKVGKALPIINGVTAQVSDRAASRLSGSASIVGVSADAAMTSASSSYDPSTPGASYAATSRATGAWGAGATGAGVTVAVLDTGIAKVPDLYNRLIAGPDLSGEHNSLSDSFGHGTVMAGLIAGSGQASG